MVLPIYKKWCPMVYLRPAQLTGQTTDYNAVLNSLIESKLLISAHEKRGVEVSEDIIEETAKDKRFLLSNKRIES